MNKKTPQLEELFRKAWDNYHPKPSSRLLRRIKIRLGLRDFLSLNLQRFNILYTFLIAGGTTATIMFISSGDVKTEEVSLTEVELNIVEEKHETAEAEELISASEEVLAAEKSAKEIDGLYAVNASFMPSKHSGCAPLSVYFLNQSEHAIEYSWDFETGEKLTEKSPIYTFNSPGSYTITLKATGQNGMVSVYKEKISVYDRPIAAFDIDKSASEIATKKIVFLNNSKKGSTYTWYFGDKTVSVESEPEHIYKEYRKYDVTLVTTSFHGCTDTASQTNRFIEKNYTLAFPWSFSPSADGRNNNGFYEKAGSETKVFYPNNNGVLMYELSIYSPSGVKVFTSKNIKQGWNGYFKGRIAPPGVYTYTASGIYPNEKPFSLKGNVRVISNGTFQDNY